MRGCTEIGNRSLLLKAWSGPLASGVEQAETANATTATHARRIWGRWVMTASPLVNDVADGGIARRTRRGIGRVAIDRVESALNDRLEIGRRDVALIRPRQARFGDG